MDMQYTVGASVFEMAESIHIYIYIYIHIYIYIYINLVIVLSEASCLSCSNSHQATSTAIQAKSQQQKHTCKTQSKAIHIHSFIRPSACMRLLCSMSMHHTKHIFHFVGLRPRYKVRCCAAHDWAATECGVASLLYKADHRLYIWKKGTCCMPT